VWLEQVMVLGFFQTGKGSLRSRGGRVRNFEGRKRFDLRAV
jgi:hypothetical protein